MSVEILDTSPKIEEWLNGQKKCIACPCCGAANEFYEEGGFEICHVCGWEDDNLQRDDPDYDFGANGSISLNQARKKWADGETLFPDHTNPKAKKSTE